MNESQELSQEETSFEQKLARLQEIVRRLESQDLPLEEGLELFKEGSELAKSCRSNLEQARHKIQVYAQGVLQDLDPEAWPKDQEEPGNEGHA
ncbi:MAG: exodeoxyribonuclease VII small subunit [Desulfohalobiaceae bacterium]